MAIEVLIGEALLLHQSLPHPGHHGLSGSMLILTNTPRKLWKISSLSSEQLAAPYVPVSQLCSYRPLFRRTYPSVILVHQDNPFGNSPEPS